MIGDLRPYPAMKDSGVPWLGGVPEHWEVMPSKRALRTHSIGLAPIKNTASLVPLEGYVPAFSAAGQDVWLPSPVFSGHGLVLSAVGARCGKTFRADGAWAVVANTHVLLPESGQSRDYWWYVTNNEDWWERAGAAQPFVQVSRTLGRPWVIPPLHEQAAIVRFLDHVDRRIRRYIAAKLRLIKLLEKQKQAIIHRVVTCGLDPNVRLKPSGVEWLGDVPEHWELLRGEYVGRLFSTPSVSDEHLTDVGDGLPMYLKVSDLASVDTDLRLSASALYVSGNSQAPVSGTRTCIVFPKRGGAIYTNKVAIVQGEFLLDPNLMGWAIADRFEPRYVALLLKTRTLADLADVSSVPQINNKHINPIFFPTPPIQEQRAILSWIKFELASLVAAESSADSEITLLREYRTRLIADVVTGKLDVRDAAAQLPEEAEDPVLLDEAQAMTDAEERSADDLDAAGELIEA